MNDKSQLPKKGFIRTIEDFECENCGKIVKGTGFTNHCPDCLWSKHADINPGDREENCGGMMKPTGYTKIGSKEKIIHQCQRCGFERSNKVSTEDSIDALINISD